MEKLKGMLNTRILIKVLISSILISGCGRLKTDLNSVLVEGKYWDILGPTIKSSYGYEFRENGTCIYYHAWKGERIEFGQEDVVVEKTWKFENKDSILTLQGRRGKVSRWNADTVFLISRVSSETVTLIRSRDSLVSIYR